MFLNARIVSFHKQFLIAPCFTRLKRDFLTLKRIGVRDSISQFFYRALGIGILFAVLSKLAACPFYISAVSIQSWTKAQRIDIVDDATWAFAKNGAMQRSPHHSLDRAIQGATYSRILQIREFGFIQTFASQRESVPYGIVMVIRMN